MSIDIEKIRQAYRFQLRTDAQWRMAAIDRTLPAALAEGKQDAIGKLRADRQALTAALAYADGDAVKTASMDDMAKAWPADVLGPLPLFLADPDAAAAADQKTAGKMPKGVAYGVSLVVDGGMKHDSAETLEAAEEAKIIERRLSRAKDDDARMMAFQERKTREVLEAAGARRKRLRELGLTDQQIAALDAFDN